MSILRFDLNFSKTVLNLLAKPTYGYQFLHKMRECYYLRVNIAKHIRATPLLWSNKSLKSKESIVRFLRKLIMLFISVASILNNKAKVR